MLQKGKLQPIASIVLRKPCHVVSRQPAVKDEQTAQNLPVRLTPDTWDVQILVVLIRLKSLTGRREGSGAFQRFHDGEKRNKRYQEKFDPLERTRLHNVSVRQASSSRHSGSQQASHVLATWISGALSGSPLEYLQGEKRW